MADWPGDQKNKTEGKEMWRREYRWTMGKVTNCVNLWSNMNSFWIVHSTEKGLSKREQGYGFSRGI